MTKRFKGFKQHRLPYWDYSSEGYYFLTFCTKNKEHFLGEVIKGFSSLNEIGCMTAKYWQEIPKHFLNVVLDEWVIMPNRMHGIIKLENPHRGSKI